MSQAAPRSVDFVPVESAAALAQLIERSREAPVVLFKHSLTCPISARAHREMACLTSDSVGEVALVVVQRGRAGSNLVEDETGVRHESPQAIILRDGRAVWSASHFDITAAAVERAVRENA